MSGASQNAGLRLPEQKWGPHRSATPEDMHMFSNLYQVKPQGDLAFIREGFVTLTPSDAATVLKRCRYEYQRDETRAHAYLEGLAEQMRRGLWLPKTQIDFARVGGQLLLINGYHRMTAMVMANTPITWSVVIHDCADMQEVRSLYWRFDTGRTRSTSNIINGIGLAGDLGLGKKSASVFWAAAQVIDLGLRFRYHEKDGRPILADERIEILKEYAAEAREYEAAAALAIPPVRKKMMTVSFFAVGICILKYQPEKGRDFWRGLCADDGLSKVDPRKALLADMQTRNGSSGMNVAQMMSVARAWSAFYHGRTISHLKVTGHAVPVAGTPFTVNP